MGSPTSRKVHSTQRLNTYTSSKKKKKKKKKNKKNNQSPNSEIISPYFFLFIFCLKSVPVKLIEQFT